MSSPLRRQIDVSIPPARDLLNLPVSSLVADDTSAQTKPPRSVGYFMQQLFRPATFKDTGLEGMPMREFLELARSKRAFFHATETALRGGWWSALLGQSFLGRAESNLFRDYLTAHVRYGSVVEVGPGANILRHSELMRDMFGAVSYSSVDLNKDFERFGAVHADALSFFSLFEDASVDTILAFGVFNEPMSLHFPGPKPPRFILPASRPDAADRSHCEHEYVRRFAREMFRVLKPGGVLLGDGLHSRGVETEVRMYLELAGLTPDVDGFTSLSGIWLKEFEIRDPFFFKKVVK